jgi:aerobic-type carbon monoxide dehydrogenase small subunit (CoxS/CutS family)
LITLTVNGTEHRLDLDPNIPLLWAIRSRPINSAALASCRLGTPS